MEVVAHLFLGVDTARGGGEREELLTTETNAVAENLIRLLKTLYNLLLLLRRELYECKRR